MSLLERIYYFHQQLAANRYPNASVLVGEFEISPATAHRDIAYLRDRLLAPLAFDQQRNGYYYEEEGFRLPFERSPRLVLLLGVLEAMARETGLETLPELKELQEKLGRLVAPRGRAVGELIHCEWPEAEPVEPEVLRLVLQGLVLGQRLSIGYAGGKEEGRRQVDPLRLLNYQGRWYLLAWCRLRRDRRLFHLARMSIVELSLEKVAAANRDQDEAYLASAFGIFKGENVEPVEIVFTGWAARFMRLQRWHPQQELRQQNDGLRLRLPVADQREILTKILQFGSHARVLAPESLRQAVIAEVEGMRALYAN